MKRLIFRDRYKDILTASDSIKSMKTISSNIVESIENITSACDKLLENAEENRIKAPIPQNEWGISVTCLTHTSISF